PRLLFYWGHQPSKDGSTTASCFSQWWPAPFIGAGSRYATAEHWMMASKARLFGDEEMVARILEAGSPKQAKELGRKVKGFDGALWDREKNDIVAEGSFQKFSQN
ncbi:NADAR family protein, partial [Mesorhizobium sp. M4B.F.Ca.ET.172.01.1.1]|uniref:NADAR family protein n=1 Tax=Mesorhizobium sp. M4B.F.Ca.ET.172.01.1.1 TaxID=2563950 RepID=UPI001094068D